MHGQHSSSVQCCRVRAYGAGRHVQRASTELKAPTDEMAHELVRSQHASRKASMQLLGPLAVTIPRTAHQYKHAVRRRQLHRLTTSHTSSYSAVSRFIPRERGLRFLATVRRQPSSDGPARHQITAGRLARPSLHPMIDHELLMLITCNRCLYCALPAAATM